MKFIAASILAVVLASPLTLSASLGGDYASVEADRAKMQASLQTTSHDAFTVHQLQAATGAGVKEYVSPAGQVFAVTWKGPTQPNLRQILGNHYSQFADALKQRAHRRGHGPVVIEQPGLVVEISGHMRAFMGRAYVPQMLPAGVHTQDIQ